MSLKERIRGEIEPMADEIVTRTALRMRSDPRILARWMGYTGADEPSGIDYANPCVMIEFFACDPQMLTLAATDGESFVRETGCDRETFFAYYDQSSERP